MYYVELVNFGNELNERFKTFDDACVAAMESGFESRVVNNLGQMMAFYSPIRGLRDYTLEER